MKNFSYAAVLLVVLSIGQGNAFASENDDIDKLDAQRNELVNRITANLVNGKLTIEEAQSLKNETDEILKQETEAKRDPSQSGSLDNITKAIQKSYDDYKNTVHPDKVWFGLDSVDKNLQQQISDILARGTVNRDQAQDLKKEAEVLRARATDPNRRGNFNEAMSLAVDLQTFENKLHGLGYGLAGK